MESLLEPTIETFFAKLLFPPSSCILQVVGQLPQQPPYEDGTNFMLLNLSDGRHHFCGFCTTGKIPGFKSLLRIIPSERNQVISVYAERLQRRAECIVLKEYVKILDGQHCSVIGNPVKIDV